MGLFTYLFLCIMEEKRRAKDVWTLQKQRKKGLIHRIVIGLVSAGAVFGIFYFSTSSQTKLLEAIGNYDFVFNPIQISDPKTSVVSMASVGDVLIHNSVYEDAQVGDTYDFKPMFRLIQPYIEQADIAIANSETIIGGSELGLSSYPTFNSPYELGNDLKAIGFDVVSMANNHTLDRGEKAIQNAINHWNKIGVIQTGASRNDKERQEIRTLTKNGITFSFLSYTYGTNGIPIPDGKNYLVNLIDKDQIKKDVKAAQAVSDVVVASMHFGNEYEKMPNDSQKSMAQYLADLGVDIILGAHPHVLQPVDWITGKNRNQTYVIYSAGNFISAQDQIDRLIGGIFGIDIKKTEYMGESWIELENPSFLPIYTSYDRFRNFKLYPLKDVPSTLLSNQEQLYKESIAHVRKYMKDALTIKINP